MREITWDKTSDFEKSFKIKACEPDEYGTVKRYSISFPAKQGQSGCEFSFYLDFQQGHPSDEINGIGDEVLLAILIDRAKNFANGPLATRENSITLTHLEEALMWKRKRVVDRINRGVLNTYNK